MQTYPECDPLSQNNPCIQTSCETESRPPIRTNTIRPVNVLRPELTNRFDWTQRIYPLRLEGWSNSEISNPVHQTGNGPLANKFGGLDQKDIQPEDGWELVRRDLGGAQSPSGSPNNTTTTPYIILYNRYTSVLRVFVARNSNPLGGTFTKIILKMNGRNVSSLFDFYKNGYIAIDEPYQGVELSAPMYILDAGGKWGYADFMMNYDPCTCFFNTNHLLIEVKKVQQSTVDLTGTITGRIATSSGMTTEQAGSSFSGELDNTINFSKKYVKGFTSFQKFLDESKKIVDLTHVSADSDQDVKEDKKKALEKLQNVIDNNTILREGLKAVPYVSLALSIYDMFKGSSSSNNGTTTTKIAPMTFNSQVRINGTIIATSNYDEITLQTPGSNPSNTDYYEIPAYDEVLGLFNLLETPTIVEEVTFVEPVISDVTGVVRKSMSMHLAKPIKYTLNPAAGVEIQDASLQIHMDEVNSLVRFENHNFSISDGSRQLMYSSPIYYNTDIMAPLNYVRVFDTNENIANPKCYVQLTVNYKRKDNGNYFVETYRFPAKWIETTDISSIVTRDQTTTWFVPASRTEITGFCNSPTYLETRFDVLKGDDRNPVALTKARKAHNLQLSPNPANDEVVLSYDIKEVSSVKAYITDLTGKIVSETFNAEVEKGDYNLSFPTQNLSNGIYLLVFEANGERTTQKLVISH